MKLSERIAIIFDFDGTLADTKAGILSTATTVLTDWGVPEADLARVEGIIGPPFPNAFELVFGLSHEDAVEVTRRYRAIYGSLGLEAWPAFPGVHELLADLAGAGRQLAVASSKRSLYVNKALEDNELVSCFATVRANEDDAHATKVDAILACLADLGVGPEDAVMVGDRHHDVDAARACGIPCVGVLYGNTAERAELEDAGAEAIATTVDELRALLLGS